MTADTPGGRQIIDWVSPGIAVAIASNGKGVKAAMELGRRAAELVSAPSQIRADSNNLHGPTLYPSTGGSAWRSSSQPRSNFAQTLTPLPTFSQLVE